MSVDWASERTTTYPASLRVECLDRMGIAGDVLKKISDNKVNLRDLKVDASKEKKTASIVLLVEVVDIAQLEKCAQAISQISDVIRVHRQDHRKKNGTTTPKAKNNNVTPLKPKLGQKKRKQD